MRLNSLIRPAFAALLAAALWLPATPVRAEDEQALAARAYERVQPALREMMKKAYLQGLSGGEPGAFAGCEAASTQLRVDLERDTTPVVMELFFDQQTQQRVQGILADVYDAEQLRMVAAGGNPPSTPAQSAKMTRQFQELNAEFQQRVAQDSRIADAMAKAMQNAVARMAQCRGQQGDG